MVNAYLDNCVGNLDVLLMKALTHAATTAEKIDIVDDLHEKESIQLESPRTGAKVSAWNLTNSGRKISIGAMVHPSLKIVCFCSANEVCMIKH